MFIRSIELVGYKRFSLNNVHRFKMAPTEKLQLILGTNGSGKSSLIRELTPLPAASQNFKKDGSKKVVIEHRGNEYLLISVFSPSQRHSFLKNGEELNPGGTATIQRDLVYTEFGITPQIHELMIGGIRFNEMSPNDRRVWLTRLADTDFTYALSVFQKLKERLRDVTGSIKINQTRAVQEANKLMSEAQEMALREEITSYRKLIDELLSMKSPKTQPPQDFQQQIQRSENQIQQLVKELKEKLPKFSSTYEYSIFEDSSNETIRCLSRVNYLETLNSDIIKEIENHHQTQQIFAQTKLSNLNELDGQLLIHQERISKLITACKDDLYFEKPINAFGALCCIQDNLTDVVTDLPENKDRRISIHYYNELKEKHQSLVQKRQGLELKQQTILNQVRQQEEEKNKDAIECPKCNYSWQRGYSKERHEQLLKDSVTIAESLTNIDKDIKKNEEDTQDAYEYLTRFKLYNSITKNWTLLNPLWDYLIQSDMIFNQPKRILSFIDQVKSGLRRAIELEELKKEFSALEELKKITLQDSNNQAADITKKLEDLNVRLFDNSQEIRSLQQRIKRIKEWEERLEWINIQEEKLTILLQQTETSHQDLIESYRQQMIVELIRKAQINLSEREYSLSQVDVQKFLVNNIQSQLSELTEEADMLKLLIRELSPTEGLIAKGLVGFINNLIRQMNNFIGKVWLYPMEILPYQLSKDEDVELDYTFPISLNDSKEPIPDIKMLSTAQSEMINLAFVIVSMKYLHLQDSTLVLDELGSSMDSAHRNSVFNAISGLISYSDFGQVFVISHFENSYGGLKNTEVTVLCDKNIVLPKNTPYNQHVIIE